MKFKCSKRDAREKQTLPLELTEQLLFACFCLGNCVLCGNKCGVILQPQIRGSAAFALPASFNCLAPREELEHMEYPPHHHHNTVSLRSAGKLLTRGAWALLALRYWAVWKGLANTMCCQVLPSRMHNVEKEAASPSVLSLSLSLCLSWTLCVSLPKSVSLSLYVCVVCVRLCVACSCVRLHVYVYMCDIG